MDDNFPTYQKRRQTAEDDLVRILSKWARENAPTDMTIGALRELEIKLIPLVNGATQECYEIGRAEIAQKQNA